MGNLTYLGPSLLAKPLPALIRAITINQNRWGDQHKKFRVVVNHGQTDRRLAGPGGSGQGRYQGPKIKKISQKIWKHNEEFCVVATLSWTSTCRNRMGQAENACYEVSSSFYQKFAVLNRYWQDLSATFVNLHARRTFGTGLT